MMIGELRNPSFRALCTGEGASHVSSDHFAIRNPQFAIDLFRIDLTPFGPRSYNDRTFHH
jgi:hypothetical protein